MTRRGRRRLVAVVWTVAVVMAGVLTLSFQDSAEPQAPVIRGPQQAPAPLLSADVP